MTTTAKARELESLVRAMRADPGEFRRALLVDTDAGARSLADVLDPWQRSDFEALDPAWLRAAGLPDRDDGRPARSRAYLERPRGHSKTTDIAVMVAWALWASPRQLQGVAAAGDRDQARLLRDAIARLSRLNPWLALDVQRDRIVNGSTGSSLEVLSADAATSYGLTPDFVVCDEITHWGARHLWDSLFSASAKRSHCLLLIISNAGRQPGGCWQWGVREMAVADERWYFSSLPGPVASWIDRAALDEQRKGLMPAAFSRLWLNQWTSPDGGALTPEAIARCTVLTGPMYRAESSMTLLAGLDLSSKRDHSALVCLAIDHVREKIMLAECLSWAPPSPGQPIDIAELREDACEVMKRLGVVELLFDPASGGEAMAQDLSRMTGCGKVSVPFTSHNLDVMARTLVRSFNDETVEIYDDCLLTRDLLRMQIVESMSGYKLKGVRDEFGHCDRGVALSIVLPAANQLLREAPVPQGGYWTPAGQFIPFD